LSAARCGGNFGNPAYNDDLAGVVAEKGGEGLEKGLAGGIGQQFLCRWRAGPRWPREDACAVRADANSIQIYVKNESS
jgi:hypothetical protein